MLRTTAVIAALATSLLGAAACVPTNSFQGFQVIDQSPTDVKVGEDRAAVLARLGSPTATATFDKDTWFYMSQVSNKTAFYHPRVVKRSVVAINFDKATQAVVAVKMRNEDAIYNGGGNIGKDELALCSFAWIE